MRFDLVDLQLFMAVADSGSITHGAERAHLALASASARIKGLEADLGVTLIRRRRRGIELTAAGESLRDHARTIMQQVAMMQGDIASFASGVRASVHLLANTSGLSEHLPKALASFLREYPDISLDVEERESADIVGAIAGGAVACRLPPPSGRAPAHRPRHARCYGHGRAPPPRTACAASQCHRYGRRRTRTDRTPAAARPDRAAAPRHSPPAPATRRPSRRPGDVATRAHPPFDRYAQTPASHPGPIVNDA